MCEMGKKKTSAWCQMILFLRHSYQRVEHFPAQFEQMECESCSGYIIENLVEYMDVSHSQAFGEEKVKYIT